MVHRNKINNAVVLAAIVALIYSVTIFIGLIFNHTDNDILLFGNDVYTDSIVKAVLFYILNIALMGLTVTAQGSKFKLWYKKLKWAFVFIAIVSIWWSWKPVNAFVGVLSHRNEIGAYGKDIIAYSYKLDTAYIAYADKRVADYKTQLQRIAGTHSANYKILLGGAAGDTDGDKINNLVTSLERRLKPQALGYAQQQHSQWMNANASFSIFNINLVNSIAQAETYLNAQENEYTVLSKTPQTGLYTPFNIKTLGLSRPKPAVVTTKLAGDDNIGTTIQTCIFALMLIVFLTIPVLMIPIRYRTPKVY